MAKHTPGGAVANYLRKYHLAPRYRREDRLSLLARDGTPLEVARVGGPPQAPCTIVLLHGFANWSRTPAVHAFAQTLARRVDVLVPDLRGHGRSGGACTFGRLEPDDLAVVVDAADPARPVVTVGVSLGGAVALLHAAQHPGSVAGVVAVSPPAEWGGLTTPGAMRIRRGMGTTAGRLVLRRLLRTRLSSGDSTLPEAGPGLGRIAPAFTVIAADPDDAYFPREHAERLHRWAGEPKALWWYPGVGHGADLLTTAFGQRLLALVETGDVEASGADPTPPPAGAG